MASTFTGPYKIYVVWITGEKQEYEVISHAESEVSLNIFVNNRRSPESIEVTIPFTNMMYFEVIKGG